MCRSLLGPPSAGGEVKGPTLPGLHVLAFIIVVSFLQRVLSGAAAAASFLYTRPRARVLPSAAPCSPPFAIRANLRVSLERAQRNISRECYADDRIFLFASCRSSVPSMQQPRPAAGPISPPSWGIHDNSDVCLAMPLFPLVAVPAVFLAASTVNCFK